MSETCRRALEKLYAYLDAELDAVSVEEITAHLEDCPPCGRSFAFERRLQLVVKSGLKEEDVPAVVIDRLRAAIRGEIG